MTVRTRIAPSPTGDPHVGTAYIALFNYCFARLHGGQFLLRIEDTDQTRSTRESEEAILDSLRWLGLSWDEGPDVGGPCGPYRQSERSEIYKKYAQILLDKGHAFKCFATPEELAEMRRNQTAGKRGYDGRYANLSAEEVKRREDAGEPYVIRMKVPDEGICVVNDKLRGTIEIDWSMVDMQILVKSDGMPTYHLANVVDDHLMGITHVMRGEEWISSAPKHILLYQYFGWEAPELIHLPLLRNQDKSKLSKRKNPTSILYYERMGIMPEALLNYLGRMAWSMPDDSEKFSLEQMVEAFTLDRVSLGGPIFDVKKLQWLNGRWIREDLDDEAFAQRVMQWALNRDYMMQIIPLVKQRIEQFSDLGPMTDLFFKGLVDPEKETFEKIKKLEVEDARKILVWGSWRLEEVKTWNRENVEACLRDTADLMGFKIREFNKPFFVAMSGKGVSTPLFETMEILGRDICRARIRQAYETLGGVSKKETKRWDKEMRAALKARSEQAE